MKEASFFVVGVGDIFPTRIDMRDHLILLHFLDLDSFLIHLFDLEPDHLSIVQQVVLESIAFVSPHHLQMNVLMIVVTKQ